jgi:hypothetical protein
MWESELLRGTEDEHCVLLNLWRSNVEYHPSSYALGTLQTVKLEVQVSFSSLI